MSDKHATQYCAPNTSLQLVDWRDYFTIAIENPTVYAEVEGALDRLAQTPEFARICNEKTHLRQQYRALQRSTRRQRTEAFSDVETTRSIMGEKCAAKFAANEIILSAPDKYKYRFEDLDNAQLNPGHSQLVSLEHALVHEALHLADPLVMLHCLPLHLRRIFDAVIPACYYDNSDRTVASNVYTAIEEDGYTVPRTDDVMVRRFCEHPRRLYANTSKISAEWYRDLLPNEGQEWRLHEAVNTQALPLWRQDPDRVVLSRLIDKVIAAHETGCVQEQGAHRYSHIVQRAMHKADAFINQASHVAVGLPCSPQTWLQQNAKPEVDFSGDPEAMALQESLRMRAMEAYIKPALRMGTGWQNRVKQHCAPTHYEGERKR